MNQQSQNSRTFFVILLATIVAFVVWFLFLVLLWLLLRGFGATVDFWTMVASVSTAVAAAAIVGAGYVAYREINELDISRHIHVADRLFEELNSLENIESRRWVYQHLPDDPEEGLRDLSPEGQRHIKRVLNSLDRVAILTQSGWIPDSTIMPWMNPMIVKSWAKLGPYVAYEGQRRGEPDYYEYARELAERCQRWRAENVPQETAVWLDDAL